MHERLGQLHALPHPGGVAADRPVALLEEADVAEDVCRPLAGRNPGQAAHLREMGDQVGRREVGREDVVLGHVPHSFPDPATVRSGVQAHHRGAAARRRQQPEEDPQQGTLAGPVGTHQSHDPRLDLDAQRIERQDAPAGARIPLGQTLGDDQRHGRSEGRGVRAGRAPAGSCRAGRVGAQLGRARPQRISSLAARGGRRHAQRPVLRGMVSSAAPTVRPPSGTRRSCRPPPGTRPRSAEGLPHARPGGRRGRHRRQSPASRSRTR